jgi:hypothetical protein
LLSSCEKTNVRTVYVDKQQEQIVIEFKSERRLSSTKSISKLEHEEENHKDKQNDLHDQIKSIDTSICTPLSTPSTPSTPLNSIFTPSTITSTPSNASSSPNLIIPFSCVVGVDFAIYLDDPAAITLAIMSEKKEHHLQNWIPPILFALYNYPLSFLPLFITFVLWYIFNLWLFGFCSIFVFLILQSYYMYHAKQFFIKHAQQEVKITTNRQTNIYKQMFRDIEIVFHIFIFFLASVYI